ncbi:transposase family protein [Streptomyces sp. NPDC014983]|uniref:transposase family protein n=1 Tax=Streptomyces sp. NPDC014983 TaxID=3364933 RepID=UPI0036FEF9BE
MADVLLQDLWFHQVEGVVIESVVSDDELVVVRARTTSGRVVCPACRTSPDRVHSRYVRRLAYNAVGGRPVLIELRVRRFRCRQPDCPQATFAEQVNGLTFRHGRRSVGLQTVLQRVAVMLAGRADARMAKVLATREPLDPVTADPPPARPRDLHASGARSRRIRAAQRP